MADSAELDEFGKSLQSYEKDLVSFTTLFCQVLNAKVVVGSGWERNCVMNSVYEGVCEYLYIYVCVCAQEIVVISVSSIDCQMVIS